MQKKNNPKNRDNTEFRRQKILGYFHNNSQKSFLITDLKKNLQISNEQNLRRDLEWLVSHKLLQKDNDKSKVPVRSRFQITPGTPATLPTDIEARKPGRPKGSGNKNASATSKVKPSAPSESVHTAAILSTRKPGPGRPPKKGAKPQIQITTGHKSARDLEAQILNLVQQEAMPAKDIAARLRRQQPTVFKALERLQRNQQLVRIKQGGRAYLYFPAGQTAPIAEENKHRAEPKVAAQLKEKNHMPSGLPPYFEELFQTAVSAAVNAAVDRIMAHKR